ncbi:MAG TPA: DMT family transporter [Xanthobacteraceae bacterium]|nr:DMT family transporter [Xanthobacteraceae bacterium]
MRNPERKYDAAGSADAGARLMLVVLCIVWGITWPIMRIALSEVPPFTMRTVSSFAGGLALFAVCLVMRRNLRLPGAKGWVHVGIAAMLNVASFSVFSTFAQLSAATSRVAILAYTMPIWAVVLAWVFLGERPTGMQPVAIGLCAAGLAILIYPLTAAGIPLGIVLALATGVSWAAGTVYLKWARIDADPMAIAIWQVVISFFVIAACMLIFEGGPDFHAAHTDGVVATVVSGLLGTGAAYGLWFTIIRRLPAMTASLGVLGSPVIGVIASVLVLGERPTAADITGFALILAASALTLLSRPSTATTASQVT